VEEDGQLRPRPGYALVGVDLHFVTTV
jgi:hypothetical protein